MSHPDRAHAYRRARDNRWFFFLTISLGLLMVALDNSILYTALPELNAQLHATPTQSLWIINAYPLMITGLLLGTGTLGDRIGHKKMFLIGLGIFGVASLAAAFAPSAWALVGARAVLGTGAAVMMPATLALIKEIFPDEQERNLAIGIWASMAVVGAALGPVVGGALLEAFWWGSVFLINVPIVCFALACTAIFAPPNRPNPDKSWDVLSSFYALIALSGLTLAIKEATRPGSSPALLAAAACAAVIGAFVFNRRQKKLDDPLLTFDIFRSRIFTGGVVAASGAMFVLIGMEMTSAQRLQLVDGLSPFHAGLAIGSVAMVALPFSIAGGALLHRIGFLTIVTGGFIAGAIGLSVSWYGSHIASIPVLIAGFWIIGAGSSFIMSVSSIAIIGAAPADRSGMAAGVEEVSYEFGTLITVAATGSILTAAMVARLPENLKAAGAEAMYDPATNPLAAPAYTAAYEVVIAFLALAAVVFALITARCFRGNPRSATVSP